MQAMYEELGIETDEAVGVTVDDPMVGNSSKIQRK